MTPIRHIVFAELSAPLWWRLEGSDLEDVSKRTGPLVSPGQAMYACWPKAHEDSEVLVHGVCDLVHYVLLPVHPGKLRLQRLVRGFFQETAEGR